MLLLSIGSIVQCKSGTSVTEMRLHDLQPRFCWSQMKRAGITFFIFAIVFGLSSCKKDPSTVPDELVQYILLCPTGLDACYNECASTTGYPGGGESAGATYREFVNCTGVCDQRCSNTALLLSLLTE